MAIIVNIVKKPRTIPHVGYYINHPLLTISISRNRSHSLYSQTRQHKTKKRHRKMSAAAGGLGKCSKIRHIVRLRQMLQRWRNKARLSAFNRGSVPDVPAGHLAVYVGPRFRRFVFPAAHLNHPVFRKLLAQVEEMYGFDRPGPLTFPCEEAIFEEALRFVSRSGNHDALHLHCHGVAGQWPESRALLNESIW